VFVLILLEIEMLKKRKKKAEGCDHNMEIKKMENEMMKKKRKKKKKRRRMKKRKKKKEKKKKEKKKKKKKKKKVVQIQGMEFCSRIFLRI
jgi:hypothetical protein